MATAKELEGLRAIASQSRDNQAAVAVEYLMAQDVDAVFPNATRRQRNIIADMMAILGVDATTLRDRLRVLRSVMDET